MSLLRWAVCLGAVVYMLPSDEQQQRELIATTESRVVWAMTYCSREPEQCRQAGEVWQDMVKKAGFAAKLAAETARRWSEQRAAGQPAEAVPLPETGPLAGDPALDGPALEGDLATWQIPAGNG